MTTALSAQALAGAALPAGELERLAAVARQAAEAGAEPLRRLFGQLLQVRAKGGAGNLVTEADLAAEAAVLAVLEAETPGFGVLAEESGRRSGSGALEWCVDP
ncbi:MAG: inositol monophosphatase family protein, partial [Cyanobacteriota bacterium]